MAMRQIETLDLSYNDIGPEGGAALAAYLGNKNSTVTRLDVSWNRLGDRAGPITSVNLATSVTVSQSRQSLPPRQWQSANHVSPSRHVSDSQPITSVPPATSRLDVSWNRLGDRAGPGQYCLPRHPSHVEP